MSQFLRSIILIGALFAGGGAQGQEFSANYFMKGCRSVITTSSPRGAQDAYDQGYCVGMVRALVETHSDVRQMARHMNKPFGS